MKTIVLFGAGKSATVLIDYLLKEAESNNWQLKVVDSNKNIIEQKTKHHPSSEALEIDITDENKRSAIIEIADVVISMMPPSLHIMVAMDCIKYRKNLLTASYVDNKIEELNEKAIEAGILFLCEMGLDPGIDHMSAMQLIHRIHATGGKINSFYSHCGGLVAPESDNNPWHYKISWNPRNVVLAGKAGAVYRLDGRVKQLPYSSLFDPGRTVEIPGHGRLAWYPNRDSLPYIPLYGLAESSTFIRTTLRHPDFCTGWKKIVELNLTDETKQYNSNEMSYKTFFETHLRQNGFTKTDTLPGTEKALLTYLGLYEDEKINNGSCTAAGILQTAIQKKLMLQPADKDMIILMHEIAYEFKTQSQKITSTLIVKGENSLHTAMAKTVGLPLGIAAVLMLQGKISLTGLHIPIVPEIYGPVLEALRKEGIVFKES